MKSPVYVLGIDPGIGGSLAFLDVAACTLFISDMPIFTVKKSAKTKSYVDAVGVGALLRDRAPSHAFIEAVHSSPQQGVVSAFSFGRSYGTALGALGALEIPLTEVPPAVWKRATGTSADKAATVARATQILPACAGIWRLKKDVDRAEAALLAYYGAQTLGYQFSTPITPER